MPPLRFNKGKTNPLARERADPLSARAEMKQPREEMDIRNIRDDFKDYKSWA